MPIGCAASPICRPCGVVEIDHRLALRSRTETASLKFASDGRVQHNAGRTAADIDDRAGDVVIPGIQDRASEASVPLPLVSSVSALPPSMIAPAPTENAPCGTVLLGGVPGPVYCPGTIDSAVTSHVSPLETRSSEPSPLTPAVYPITLPLPSLSLQRRSMPNDDVAVGAAGHRADAPRRRCRHRPQPRR